MPYLITTRPRYAAQSGPHDAFEATRRAVATLEEAREAAVNVWYASEPGDRDEHSLARRDACLHLPEFGGTVGPLPDGTVIEVERVSPYALLQRIEGRTHRNDWTATSIIDAYNARHGHVR